MRIVIAVVAATLLLGGCKRMVGPAPETPEGNQAAAAAAEQPAPAADTMPPAADDMSAGQVPNPAVDPATAPVAEPPAASPPATTPPATTPPATP